MAKVVVVAEAAVAAAAAALQGWGQQWWEQSKGCLCLVQEALPRQAQQ